MPTTSSRRPMSSSASSSDDGPPLTEVHTASVAKGGATFVTDEGTIRVQPFKPKGSKGLKALVSFQPRPSHFDLQNPDSSANPFRGFFGLFWIGMFLLFCRTVIDHYMTTGYPLSSSFYHLLTGNALNLVIADGILVGSSFGAYVFAKGMQKGWWGYGWTVVGVQHLMQTLYLAVTVKYTVESDAWWTQSGYLVLHCLSMMMKIHSYIAHNGYMCNVRQSLLHTERDLDALLARYPGGSQAAFAQALSIQQQTQAEEVKLRAEEEAKAASALNGGVSEVSTPGSEILTDRHSVTLSEAGLRHRLNIASRLADSTLDHDMSTSAAGTPSNLQPPPSPSDVHPLSFHPSHNISTLAKNVDEYRAELTSTGVKKVVWPANVSVYNYCDYLLVPSLVYELEWPRTNKMRPLVVFEKICALIGTLSLIYLITEHYIMPVLPKEGDYFFVSFVNLALPMVVDYLLIFYIIFEVVCGGFAELTYFADREFYQDWWNSTSWDEFARKWNKPVHVFLLRHVYTSSLSTGKVSRNQATFLTFLLSACCHELVMAVVSRKLRPYLFVLQMGQIPLIMIGRIPMIKKNKLAGNIVFWLGLLSGFPLLAIGYLMY